MQIHNWGINHFKSIVLLELETLLSKYENDLKFSAAQLKDDPKDARYLEWHESLKASQDEANAALRELQDPADQLRGKG